MVLGCACHLKAAPTSYRPSITPTGCPSNSWTGYTTFHLQQFCMALSDHTCTLSFFFYKNKTVHNFRHFFYDKHILCRVVVALKVKNFSGLRLGREKIIMYLCMRVCMHVCLSVCVCTCK